MTDEPSAPDVEGSARVREETLSGTRYDIDLLRTEMRRSPSHDGTPALGDPVSTVHVQSNLDQVSEPLLGALDSPLSGFLLLVGEARHLREAPILDQTPPDQLRVGRVRVSKRPEPTSDRYLGCHDRRQARCAGESIEQFPLDFRIALVEEIDQDFRSGFSPPVEVDSCILHDRS